MQRLLELSLLLLLQSNRFAHVLQFGKGRTEQRVLAKVQALPIVLWIQTAQRLLRRGRTVCWRRGITDDVIPKQPLQVDQPSNQWFIAFNAMDFQVLTTEQYRHISGLLTGDGELVHDLQLHIFGHTFLPEACAVYAGGLAFEDLHLWRADHLTVYVG
ncbi:hypothetical protein D3C87_1221720 [compost metagenome]